MIDPLSILAIQHGTDKFGYHDYTPNYHKLFERFRDRPINVLEIGVGGYADEDRGGQSLATWRDYFPLAQITGIDIQKKQLDLGDRVQVLQGSQVDPDFLAHLVATRGPFDLIIDDGSHRNEHVVESYGILFPTLVPGGIYVAEDVQTAFIPRFGGSLTLDAPNSVGYFAGIMTRFGTGDSDPLVADVAAMERFHNMVALHKADPGNATGGLAASNAFEMRGNQISNILCVDLDLPQGLGQGLGRDGAQSRRISSSELAGDPDQDIVVLRSDAGPDTLRAGFARLRSPGFLCLIGAPDVAMTADLHDRFVQVDHREIVVQFPKAAIDPMATEIYAVERHRDGVILMKAPNDYPSNFAFDATQPQAKAALAEMELVLHDSAIENGLVQYANILTLTGGREAARPWLDKLAALGATSRVFFQLAIGLAQRERRLTDAEALCRAALVAFADDVGFALSLAMVLMSQARAHDALDVAEAALAVHPRDVNLHIQMTRIAEKLVRPELGIKHARAAIAMSPAPRRPQPQTILGEFLTRTGQIDEAEKTLRDAVSINTRFAPKAFRALSGVLKSRGDQVGALEAAMQAATLAPETKEFSDWAAALRG